MVNVSCFMFSFFWLFFFVGTSEGEDSSCEDSKQGVENGAAKKTIRDSNATAKQGHQPVFGKYK